MLILILLGLTLGGFLLYHGIAAPNAPSVFVGVWLLLVYGLWGALAIAEHRKGCK